MLAFYQRLRPTVVSNRDVVAAVLYTLASPVVAFSYAAMPMVGAILVSDLVSLSAGLESPGQREDRRSPR